MPVLTSQVKTAVVDLVSLEGGKVTVVTEPTTGQMEEIMKLQKDIEGGSVVIPLTVLITEWNLQDDKGAVLPITEENIRKLSYKDVSKISAFVKDAISQEAPKV